VQIFCFASIPDQWRRIITALIEDKQEPKCEQPKNTSDTKSENPLVFLMKTENEILRTEKYTNRNQQQNPSTEVFSARKPRNRSSPNLKNYQNRKTENTIISALNSQ